MCSPQSGSRFAPPGAWATCSCVMLPIYIGPRTSQLLRWSNHMVAGPRVNPEHLERCSFRSNSNEQRKGGQGGQCGLSMSLSPVSVVSAQSALSLFLAPAKAEKGDEEILRNERNEMQQIPFIPSIPFIALPRFSPSQSHQQRKGGQSGQFGSSILLPPCPPCPPFRCSWQLPSRAEPPRQPGPNAGSPPTDRGSGGTPTPAGNSASRASWPARIPRGKAP